jgi:hypothetical protein
MARIFFKALLSVALMLIAMARPAGAFVLSSIIPSLDCVEFHVVGPCVCEYGYGIKVAYWEPSVVVETTPQCGLTYLPPPASLEIAALSPLGCDNFLMDRLLSSSYQSVGDMKSHRFADVHVAWIPMPLNAIFSAIDILCRDFDIPEAGLVYASEPDFLHWRLGFRDILDGMISSTLCPFLPPYAGVYENKQIDKYCMGAWGPVYPRTGNLDTLNRVVHSAGIAYRGILLASELKGEFADSSKDLQDIMFSPRDKLQLLWPPSSNPVSCVRIGWPAGDIPPAIPWDAYLDGPQNPGQHFIWLHWKYTSCCICV